MITISRFVQLLTSDVQTHEFFPLSRPLTYPVVYIKSRRNRDIYRYDFAVSSTSEEASKTLDSDLTVT